MLKRKARLHKHTRQTGSYKEYKQFQKDCKRQFRKAEWNYINDIINAGFEKNSSKPFWNYMKAKKQDNIGVAPLKSNGGLTNDSKEKEEILNNQFKSVFTKLDPNSQIPPLKKRSTSNISKLDITSEGVHKLLKNVNPSKAMGPDGIPNTVLKTCAEELAPSISAIFQKSIDTGTLPEDWLSANIAPVFKKGDVHAAENYRPVSLTCVSCKLLEHIICKHILKHLEKHKILTNLNHGFRSGYSCTTQLLVTTEDLLKSFDSGIQLDMAILDFSKAFDTVPHNKLLAKLNSFGIDGNLNKWLAAFLQKRSMRVVVEGEHSEYAHIDSGVPQGTVLGPLLFLCHINDLPESVKSQVRLFADDCLLYREIKNTKDHQTLQEDLKALEVWALNWGMKFNAKKCYIMSFKQKSTHFYQLDNHILEQVQTNPYLGLNISDDLKWTSHIGKTTSKASCTLGFLRRNLRQCPQECKKLAYLAMVRSVLEYGAVIWDPFTI